MSMIVHLSFSSWILKRKKQ